MDYRPRIRRLNGFLLLLFLVLGAGVFFRMIVQEQALSAKRFTDRKREALIRVLAEEGIITPDGKGVRIDEKRLAQRIPGPGARQYILDRKPYMSFQDQGFHLDPSAISVADRRWMQDKVEISRGKIFDRNMQVLAETRTDGRGNVQRVYPLGPACFPLLGVAHPVYGKKGLERYLDHYLKGEADHGMFDAVYRVLSGREKTCDAVLTIDARLQKAAYEALDERPGAVVVLEVSTGEILAAASAPSFNPGLPPGLLWDEAEAKGRQGPFVNRALSRRYPPGSTFKLVVASAILEDPEFDEKWGIDCRGRHPRYNIREHNGKHHGWMGLENAVTMSCNVFFAEAGVRLGPRLLVHSRLYGFNKKMELVDQAIGPSPLVMSRAFTGLPQVNEGRAWEPLDFKRNPKLVAQGAIGQNSVEATPLQVARIGSCIAHSGVMMAPLLLKQIQFSKIGGSSRGMFSVKSFSPQKAVRVMSPETARQVLAMMKNVTDKGTGYRLQKLFREDGQYRATWKLPENRENLFAGKTGTAETGRGTKDHSWFLAVAPADRPRYAVAVVIENGGYGANAAGPAAFKVMQEALNLKL